MSDTLALNLLDKLLDEDAAGREALLRELELTDPELHSRLKGLLESALSTEHSRALAAPVVEGMAHIAGDATRALAAGDVLAGYVLIRELGRGGMSVVWVAQRADGVVKREVALKMPMFMLTGATDTQRFERERDALASLSHPNVARLFDAGVLASGQPFIVLERINGVPLNVYSGKRKLDIPGRLRLFLQVLSAVEHAHRHLIVHRDLKPSNILVDTDGQAKLLDFGIAKLLGETEPAAQLTQAKGGAMTPLYAAPEQIRGETISTLTDVYSLGVVLHELLTGELPYRGRDGAKPTLVDVLEAFKRGELPRASQAPADDNAALRRRHKSAVKLGAALAGDIETIVGKCLRLKPEDRYTSVAHVSEDICRYLDQKPIAARPPGFWYSLRLALARHRLAVIVTCIGLALVAGASVVAWRQHLESVAHAERTAIVRDFMFDLVNDAEADGAHTGGEVTGRQMVDGAVRRANQEFSDQPLLQGELLGQLGRMYTRLGVAAAAVPVLSQSQKILDQNVPTTDAALNKTRVFLAEAMLHSEGDVQRIRGLASQARDECRERSVDCAKARAYAGNILSQLASNSGDSESALAAMRQSVADTVLAFGDPDTETAMAYVSLATIARNGGHPVAAGEAMRHAMASAKGQRLRAADRTSLERTMAVVDIDLGNYDAARARLTSSINNTADDGERGLQSRLLANVESELGNASAALSASETAMALLPVDWTDQVLFAHQVHARALSLAGRHDEALPEIDAVIRGLTDGGKTPESYELLRAGRFHAEILLRAERTNEAIAELREIHGLHESHPSSVVEHGLALDLLGDAEARAGFSGEARASNTAARIELGRQLPATHPFMVRNAALRVAADK